MKKNILHKNNKIQFQNKRLNSNIKTFLLIGFIIFIISAFIFYSSLFNFDGVALFKQNFKDLFNPITKSSHFKDQNLFMLSIKFLFETLIYISAGTFFGFIFALVSSYFGSKFSTLKRFNLLINIVLIILRAFPVLVFLTAFQNGFNATFSLLLVYMWFTWLWVHKGLINIFNNVDTTFYNQSIWDGTSKIKAFYVEIYLRVQTRIFTFYLTAFSSNIRWLTLLSRFGVFTIGFLIITPLEDIFKYNELLIPLLIYIFIVIVIDTVKVYLIKNVFISKSRKVNFSKDLMKQKPKIKIFVTLLIVIITLFFIVFAFFRIKFSFKKADEFSNFINGVLFTIPKILFQLSNKNISPILLIFEVLLLALVIVSISSYFGFWFGTFQAVKFNNKIVVYLLRTITTILHAVPVLFLIFFTNTLWLSSVTVLMLAIMFHQTLSVSKYVTDQLNTVDSVPFYNYKMQGYSYLKAVRIYVFPSVKLAYLDYVYFQYGELLRTIIFLGIYGEFALGSLIDESIKAKDYGVLSSYIYVIVFTIALIEYFNILIKMKHYKKVYKVYLRMKRFMIKKNK